MADLLGACPLTARISTEPGFPPNQGHQFVLGQWWGLPPPTPREKDGDAWARSSLQYWQLWPRVGTWARQAGAEKRGRCHSAPGLHAAAFGHLFPMGSLSLGIF